jgi:hypothetical protein
LPSNREQAYFNSAIQSEGGLDYYAIQSEAGFLLFYSAIQSEAGQSIIPPLNQKQVNLNLYAIQTEGG